MQKTTSTVIFTSILFIIGMQISPLSVASAISDFEDSDDKQPNMLPKTHHDKSLNDDPFAKLLQKSIKSDKSNDIFIETDPVRSANEPSIAAHPYDPNIVLAFEGKEVPVRIGKIKKANLVWSEKNGIGTR